MTTTKAQKPSRDALLEMALEAVENDDLSGFCLACGEQADAIEPDARKYECDSCGAMQVYGAEELVLMLGI